MKQLHVILLVLLAVIYTILLFAEQSSNDRINIETNSPTLTISDVSTMKIRLTVNDRSITATLIDSPTARDFISLLPLTLILEDYAGTEKIANLSRKLSREDAPAGFDPSVGVITYYAPWGNLALFYKDFGYAKGLIKLGSIDEDAGVFNMPGSVTVTIDPWKEQLLNISHIIHLNVRLTKYRLFEHKRSNIQNIQVTPFGRKLPKATMSEGLFTVRNARSWLLHDSRNSSDSVEKLPRKSIE